MILAILKKRFDPFFVVQLILAWLNGRQRVVPYFASFMLKQETYSQLLLSLLDKYHVPKLYLNHFMVCTPF